MSNTATRYTSDYVQWTKFFRPNQQEIVKVYVEDLDDQQFWRTYLEHSCPNKTFSIDYYRLNNKAIKGKDYLLKCVGNQQISLGPYLMLCIDNDFNPWLSNYHHYDLIDANKYIINTYWHSIESFLCHPQNLRNYHLTLTRVSKCDVDYVQVMEQISANVYPLFVAYLVSQQVAYNPSIHPVYSVDEFTSDLEQVIESWPNVDTHIKERCDQIFSLIELESPGYELEKIEIEQKLADAHFAPKDCYVLIQGHALQYGIVYPLMYQIVNLIHHKKLEELQGGNNTEVNAYQNKTYEESLDNENKTKENFQKELADLIEKNHDVFIDPAYSVIKSEIFNALN